MSHFDVDVAIVGAGPVGLMCAYLANLCGLRTTIFDKTSGPLEVGRADALNGRTLQLLEITGLFDEIFPLGKVCNTSSVWANGGFVSRQSHWWENLEGCLHKHFLMIGQSYIEKILDQKLTSVGCGVKRRTEVQDVSIEKDICFVRLANGETLTARYVIGADGPRSVVRSKFQIPFEITRPEIIWAVIDGVINFTFPKVDEIIVFQATTSDVAWIPREGRIDRFYVRMDKESFTMEEVVSKINQAMAPHTLSFASVEWFSHFSVKESVAESFSVDERVFLAGDASHIHSVNGGQGINTGLADAFNLIWKINQVVSQGASSLILKSYEAERKPVALSVIESSGELVRSTKFSASNSHAMDYVKIVKKRAGNITGMGIRYGNEGLTGERFFDFEVFNQSTRTRIYSLLDYTKHTVIVFGEKTDFGSDWDSELRDRFQLIWITQSPGPNSFQTTCTRYKGIALLVRPDGYIGGTASIEEMDILLKDSL